MIKFYSNEIETYYVSVYQSYITLNKDLLKFLDNAYRVRIGMDEDEKKVYVFVIDKDKALSGEIEDSELLKLSVSKTYARICSSKLIKYIQDTFKFEIEANSFKKFSATWNQDLKAIIINILEEL